MAISGLQECCAAGELDPAEALAADIDPGRKKRHPQQVQPPASRIEKINRARPQGRAPAVAENDRAKNLFNGGHLGRRKGSKATALRCGWWLRPRMPATSGDSTESSPFPISSKDAKANSKGRSQELSAITFGYALTVHKAQGRNGTMSVLVR